MGKRDGPICGSKLLGARTSRSIARVHAGVTLAQGVARWSKRGQGSVMGEDSLLESQNTGIREQWSRKVSISKQSERKQLICYVLHCHACQTLLAFWFESVLENVPTKPQKWHFGSEFRVP